MDEYGFEVTPSRFFSNGVIGPIERSMTGNVVLRVGHRAWDAECQGFHGWTQTEHVVLTQAEARKLAEAIVAQCGEDSTPKDQRRVTFQGEVI